ncbi:MAG TPA: sensor histidine kinase [Trichocoleus sp.]|jgi:signal transduction histidine kinase
MNWMSGVVLLGTGFGLGTLSSWMWKRSRLQDQSIPPSSASSTEQAISLVDSPPKRNPDELEIATLRQQLQTAQLACQMAAENAQFKAGFLSRASHELRSPINSVISLHQLILADLADNPAEEREFVAQAYGAAQKMLALLDELIGISKLGHGTASLQLQPLRLQDIFLEVQQFTHLQAENRNLQLKIDFPDPTIYVQADPRWLTQVLIHLVDTPLKWMQEGFVALRAKVLAEQDQVRIQIEDQRSIEYWEEALDLLPNLREAIAPSTSKAIGLETIAQLPQSPSSGLTLLMDQAVLEMMGGRMTLQTIPIDPLSADTVTPAEKAITRIECFIPLTDCEIDPA